MALIDDLTSDPSQGDVMEGTGGARKVRWAAKGKGKSGGARVIPFYAGSSCRSSLLLAAFSKGERANLSKPERNELRDVLGELARTYRRSRRST